MPFNSIFSWIIKKRVHQIDLFKKYPFEVQNEVFHNLIEKGTNTEYGKTNHFSSINNYEDFNKTVPLNNYETLKPFVDRIFKNEQNVLWNSDVKWFAQSSGTVSHKSKFIPVSKESLHDCHYKGGKDLLSLYYNQIPKRKVYKGKHLSLGGSTKINDFNTDSYFGDLSAIILKNMPWWAELKRTPAKEIALISEWEEKLEKLALSTIKEDVYILAGVPSWILVLCQRILEITGKTHLREVWPNLELFMHGGVSFEPYREQFKKLIPFEDMNYVESYNASEGFFGIQDDFKINELLLMLDYGVFYEFIPMNSFDGLISKTVISLKDVEIGKNYALVITTNAGLWRYIIGDTIKFTSTTPYRFKISGRTKCYINAFGEELIVENAEKAIAETCLKMNAQVREFTAAPIFMEVGKKGGHEWLIEFSKLPDDVLIFSHVLDEELKKLNSDYEAKRSGGLSLQMPIIRTLKKGTFDQWLKQKGKLGGQNKIPRLMNNRSLVEEILLLKKKNN
jgi:hypothetical protein